MQENSAPTCGWCQPFAQKSHDTVKRRPVQIFVGRGPPTQRKQFIRVPFLARNFRDDLLSQHINRRQRNRNNVEISVADRPDHRDAFDQFIPSQGE